MSQLTKDAGNRRILVRNRKEQERRAGPTSHATVLLMPTQKFMCSMLEIENVFDPTGPFTIRAAQFIRMFLEKSINHKSVTEALDVYESFHVLEALPTRWIPTHLFKCNCSAFFVHASYAHVLLARMVSDHLIEIPVSNVSPTFQVRRKRGRPSVSGQNAEVCAVEEEKCKKVHEAGYEVPCLTIRLETMDHEDFEQAPPSHVAFALHHVQCKTD